MTRVVRVRRVVTAEYTVPVEYYTNPFGGPMTDEQIRAVELDDDIAPEAIWDNVVDEQTTVTFEDAAVDVAR